MREIVIVISDLYLGEDLDGGGADSGRASATAAAPALTGLADASRFGQKSALNEGWRAWLTRSIGREDLAVAAPAAIAAADEPSSSVSSAGTVWIATPIYLIAGLTSLHLDYRSLLSLPADDLTRLAKDFAAIFGSTEFHLSPTPSGALLLQSQATLDVVTTEPSRALAHEMEASLPTGRDASVLKRLGAEIEMWLHNHPLNEARARRGELPVSTLWLWGGGPSLQINDNPPPPKRPPTPDAAPTADADLTAEAAPTADPGPTAGAAPTAGAGPTSSSQPAPLSAFGSDPYLVGLCRLNGIPLQRLPDRLPDPQQLRGADRVILVAEITPLLHANPHWTMFEALAHIDSHFIQPAMSSLRRAGVDSVRVVANDTQLHVRRRDRMKFWRPRPKSAVAALRAFC